MSEPRAPAPPPPLDAMAQSPIRRLMVSENCAACAFQRTSSPPSAEMSALAASMRRCVAAASSSSACGGGVGSGVGVMGTWA